MANQALTRLVDDGRQNTGFWAYLVACRHEFIERPIGKKRGSERAALRFRGSDMRWSGAVMRFADGMGLDKRVQVRT
ncbi:MAG TPA: hypothetical protein DDZ51_09515 [Planctomycetaceae bacterium]|nr:hypothetical protein [Planctomycetaceae bacterium]